MFTTRGIDALKPAVHQLDHWDTALRGFGFRISPKGARTWNLIYRFEGRQRRLTLGRYPEIGLAEARSLAEIAKGQLARNIDPAAERDATREAGTFGELCREYLERHAKREKRTWTQDERVINRSLLPVWEHTKLTTLRKRDIRRLVDGIVERGAPIAANRTLSLIKSIFRFAVDHDWIEESPCDGLRSVSKENRRDRALSEEEIRTLWSALDQSARTVSDVLKVQLLTAQRIGEVFRMSWRQIDLQKGLWTIPTTIAKNGKEHRVPLSADVLRILRQRRLRGLSDWVFPAPQDKKKHVSMSTVHKLVMALRTSPGINFRTHDLRRTAATQMAKSGVSRFVLARVLNHADREVTARYDVYPYDSEKRAALDAWAVRLKSIADGTLIDSTSSPVAATS